MRGLSRFLMLAVLMVPEGTDGGAAGGGTTSTDGTQQQPAAAQQQPAVKKPWARATLEKLNASREQRAADAKAKAASTSAGTQAPAIPPDVQSAADRWKAHEKSERERIKAAAANLADDDRALVESEPDIGRQAQLLARFTRTTEAPKPPKSTATPKPAGGPPSSSTVDFAAALKDPKALADAKARDPEGWKKFFSAATSGQARKSTLG